MELTSQVAVLQDEVKLLKGEIKSILKEIRTAVLSRDNPFSAGLDAMAAGGAAQQPTAQEPILTPVPPAQPEPIQPIAQPVPQTQPEPTPQPAPVPAPQPSAPAPAWSGPVPEPQAAPEPFWPNSPAPQQAAMTAAAPVPPQATTAQPVELDVDVDEAGREPIPIRKGQAEASPVPAHEGPSWSLPAIAGLAVWAEDALTALGPRRFQFVLELASFADLLNEDAREVLVGLIDADSLTSHEERPINVNECLVVLRQLEAIVHGEKIVKLPRRKGLRHRRIR